jgi:RNA polymerase sigma factor (TIGR02999 family)
MRQILVDFARTRGYLKRGAALAAVSFDEASIAAPQPPADIVALDHALTRLSEMDPRKGQVVELRFFGGLNIEETAEVLKVSPETVMRDWKTARIWLLKEISAEASREA